ncbi:hypothetical protein AGR1A_Cc10224 [Agrobacterium fabacearum CFBP 5771]|nr:hypothetical protein AGR1A_Cc10224 [Agrobacterium fabacearum CFBP 5771]
MFLRNSIATKPLLAHFPLNCRGGAPSTEAVLNSRVKVNGKVASTAKRGTSATVEKTSH